MARATFAARAHDGVETTFRQLAGVTSLKLGFLANPAGQGALSVVEVRFDPTTTSYTELLEVYWRLFESQLAPGTAGEGSSVVFYHDGDQRGEAMATKIRLERSGQSRGPIATEILPATPWLDFEAALPPDSYGADASAESPAGSE